MRFHQLRWLTTALPIFYTIALILIEDFILESLLGRLAAHIFTFTLVTVGAFILTIHVFRVFNTIEQHLLRQNHELNALNEASRVLSSALELKDIAKLALDKVLEISGSQAGEIILVDPSTGLLTTQYQTEQVTESIEQIPEILVQDSIPALVVKSNELIVIADLKSDMRFKRRDIAANFQSMASIPLRAKNSVVGVLNVYHCEKQYGEETCNLLSAVGNQIGLAIDNSRLYARIEETVAHLNAVIDGTGDGIITSDLHGHITSWNAGAEEIYGWTAQEAMDNYLPMVPEHLLPEAKMLLNRLQNGETVRNFETQRLNKSGNLISVVVTASPIQDIPGNIMGFAGISKDITENKNLQAEISQQRQSVAILEERERIAREMHDGLAQVLGYVNIKVQAARRFLQTGNTDEAQTQLLQLESAARDVYADVRESIFGLRTSVSDKKNLLQVLEEYLTTFENQWHIKTKLELNDATLLEQLSLPVEVQLIRIIQEALTNVRKHAQANTVCIAFDRNECQARITIADDGNGFPPTEAPSTEWPRFGLQTMRERAEGVDGSLTIKSLAGSGTCICVTLPLNSNKNGKREQ